MKLYWILLLFILCINNVHAQKLVVEGFAVKTNDITARTQPRKDINETDCALVRVQLAASNAVFEGNVIGDVAYNTSEYLVYMAQGSKKVTVKLEGYLPLDVNFPDHGINRLESKTTYQLTISGVTGTQQIEAPKTKTGWIILDSEPSGASVYINDEFVGNTPLSNYKQTFGTYQYRLESLNYHPASGTIELNTGRFEQKVILKPAFGSISVNSSVSGAKIMLDGRQTDKQTPAMLTEIPSGTHTITIQMDKYAPKQQEVIVEDGQTANVSLTLDARFARITITSLEDAEIYSNGQLMGKGRISNDMMEGYYDLEARLDHHKSVTKQIQVVAGQSQDITLNPVPKYGSLDIISSPHDADITIDGKSYGKTPFTVEQLLEGEHTLTLSKEGYSPFKKVVNISENNTETITATMQEGAQLLSNKGDSSIKLVGSLTDKDWENLEQLLKNNPNIRSVDLSQAECNAIPSFAFAGNSFLTNISLPNSVTSIGEFAFKDCKSLLSINIPNNVIDIGKYAFKDCKELISIIIPNSVTTIGENAFEGTRWFNSQPSGLVYAGRVVYQYKGDKPNGTRITLKDGTTGIANGAFYGRRELTSITIPNSVISIGEKAFANFFGLTSITIPNSVISIGEKAFANCSGLTSIIIPNSVTSIGNFAFNGCTYLESITIPSSVTTIGENAFMGCLRLTVYVPKGTLNRFNKEKIGSNIIIEK